MADISSIKLPSGNTYNLKDSVARDKPDFDNFPTNPFSADVNKKLYINKIDNAFYCADKRWTVVVTLYDSNNAVTGTNSGANLFDGNYESQITIPSGGKAVISITFDPTFPSYPYGYMFLSFYYTYIPANVTGRVYCNYASQGVGWHDLSWAKTSYGSVDGNNWSTHNGYYSISQIEITVTGRSSGQTQISQLEMHLDRPHPSRNPFVSKYSAETLYYPLTAPSFVGNVTGNLTGSATLTGTPTAPTASVGTNNTQIATTAFVKTAIDNAGGGGNTLVFTNKTVSASAWSSNSDLDYYGYRASIALSGVTASMMPQVTFTDSQLAEYDLAPICQSYAGGVYIYSAEAISEAITIPSIGLIGG